MEQKNNNNMFDDKPTGELTFGKMMKVLQYSFVRIIVYVLIAAILASILTVALVVTDTPSEKVSTIIEYNYDGIDEGLDPNGAVFNKDRIKNVSILDSAIKNANLHDHENLSTQSLSNALSINGVIPASVLAQIKDLQENINKDPNTNTQIANIKYYPTRFLVTINNYNTLGLSKNDATTLLNEIIKAYQEYWAKTYMSAPVISTDFYQEIAAGDIKYEFYQYETLLSTQLDILANFLSSNTNVSYISSNGDTYSGLARELSEFRKTVLNDYFQFISLNNVYKDKDFVIATLNYDIKTLNEQKSLLEAMIPSYEAQVKEYKPSQIYIPTEDGKYTIQTSYPAEYWALQNKIISEKQKLISYDESIKRKESMLETINSESAASKEQLEEAESRLKDVATLFLKIANDTQTLTDEYRGAVSLTTSVYTVTPATATTENSISNKIFLIIYAGAVLVAFVVAVFVTVKIQKKFILIKKNTTNTGNTHQADEITADIDKESPSNEA